MSEVSNTPKSLREMTSAEWLHEVERAASVLVQHTYSGEIILGVTRRDDLLAVRREDWDALYALLEPS